MSMISHNLLTSKEKDIQVKVFHMIDKDYSG